MWCFYLFLIWGNQTVKPIFLKYSRYQNIEIEDEEGKTLKFQFHNLYTVGLIKLWNGKKTFKQSNLCLLSFKSYEFINP